jgi:hypothetical protein
MEHAMSKTAQEAAKWTDEFVLEEVKQLAGCARDLPGVLDIVRKGLDAAEQRGHAAGKREGRAETLTEVQSFCAQDEAHRQRAFGEHRIKEFVRKLAEEVANAK